MLTVIISIDGDIWTGIYDMDEQVWDFESLFDPDSRFAIKSLDAAMVTILNPSNTAH